MYSIIKVDLKRCNRMSSECCILIPGRQNQLLTESIVRYQKMMRPQLIATIKCVKHSEDAFLPGRFIEEAALRVAMPKQAYPIALCEKGTLRTSIEFANFVSGFLVQGKMPCFLIGSAYGLSPGIVSMCKDTISLSPLTFTHPMALLLLIEQLYRACSILKNHPYHK